MLYNISFLLGEGGEEGGTTPLPVVQPAVQLAAEAAKPVLLALLAEGVEPGLQGEEEGVLLLGVVRHHHHPGETVRHSRFRFHSL